MRAAIKQAIAFCSSVSMLVSRITFTGTGRAAPTTPRMSSYTAARSPESRPPMSSTISTSSAPSATVMRASSALASRVIAPRGKPTTVHTMTSDPASRSTAVGTHRVLTQTEAKPCSRASSHNFSMALRVASGLSSVWSMRPARVVEVRFTAGMSTSSGAGPRESMTAVLARVNSSAWSVTSGTIIPRTGRPVRSGAKVRPVHLLYTLGVL